MVNSKINSRKTLSGISTCFVTPVCRYLAAQAQYGALPYLGPNSQTDTLSSRLRRGFVPFWNLKWVISHIKFVVQQKICHPVIQTFDMTWETLCMNLPT